MRRISVGVNGLACEREVRPRATPGGFLSKLVHPIWQKLIVFLLYIKYFKIVVRMLIYCKLLPSVANIIKQCFSGLLHIFLDKIYSKIYRCLLVCDLKYYFEFYCLLDVVFWKIMFEVNGRPDRGFSADRTVLTAATRSGPQFQPRPQH